MSRSYSSRRRGFTLVELLVVIGIIAVLIAILLPVLSSARKQANVVKCSSAMRQLGYAFTLYSRENKDKYPCLKWSPAGSTDPSVSYYWNDFLLPYLSKSAGLNAEHMGAGGGGTAATSLDRAKASILWSCPEWIGSYAEAKDIASWIDAEGKVIFETGYGYNAMPYYTSASTSATSSAAMITSGSGSSGVYYNFSKWAPYADRCLVTEANLWFMWVTPTDPSTHVVLPQAADRDSQRAADTIASYAHPGWNNIDRYRHGKYPRRTSAPWGAGLAYDDKDSGGRVKFNMLYADGHVVTLLSIKDGFKAFQLRDP